MTINYNRDKLAIRAANQTLNKMVQSAFAGGNAGVILKEKRFDLVVRFKP